MVDGEFIKMGITDKMITG